MSPLRGQRQHSRYFAPAGSLASSPPNATYQEGARHNYSSPRGRRASGFGSASPNHGPFPYESEPRSYGVPNIEVLGFPHHGNPAGSSFYYCGWDSLATGAFYSSTHTENVLLVGSEGTLDTYLTTENKLTHYGRLENLPGAVLDARTLPDLDEKSAVSMHEDLPLVILTLHGPIIRWNEPYDRTRLIEAEERVMTYQTSVEIYSLRTAKHICTLFRTKPVDLDEPFGSKRFVPPPPQGDLRIEVRSRFLVVTSGISGEVFIFKHGKEPRFQCLAKLWTSIQIPRSYSVSSEPDFPIRCSPKPILSLSLRWLALVPPTSASSINGEIPLVSEDLPRPPGFNSFACPERPVEDCVIDAPDVETLLNRASKYVIKNSRVLGEKSREAWNNYWGPSQQFSSPATQMDIGLPPTDYFPPTHGIGNTHSAPNRDPTLVGVYDLERLAEHAEGVPHQQTLKPLATFPAPLGCSFLSFSPDGRYLMTVSDKGEYQFIWHCFDIANTEASLATRHNHEGVLREVTRFSRNSEANIVDVSWKYPYGEVVAILTAKGTIHVHALPPEATAWPLKSRAHGTRGVAEDDADLDRPLSSDWASSAVSGAKMALGSLSSAARRTRSSSSPGRQPTSLYSSIGSTLGSVASSGSRFVTKGVTSGYGFASDQLAYLRHASDNKIHLPPSHLVSPSPQRIRYPNGAHSGSLIAVIEDGHFTLYTYHIATIASSRKGIPRHRLPIIDTTRAPLRTPLPTIPDALYPPVFATLLDTDPAGAPFPAPEFDDLQLDGANESSPDRRGSAHPIALAKPKARLDQLAAVTKGALISSPRGRRDRDRGQEWRAAAEMSSAAKTRPLYRQPGVRFFVFEEGWEGGGNDRAVREGEDDDFGLEGMDGGGERWVFGGALGRKRRVKVEKVTEVGSGREDREEEGDEGWEEVK
ncbi:hypothetical protein EV356DRAFT_508288 [Viridothelium virens]|uniref:WD40 repeat-like protein n=1 Tax=Viridothelium virens TaxID=1048519 RepID=A0A6A6GYI5_VIRVR|nr:hypothetical protein EV356DRAFT_508288 [Viridothelium virens]